ncbi:MAG: ATP-binding cassette domain-containing protein [Marinobacter sp.]|uniref:ABC transporter ATP-binding protein n=1 Tax=Marinobacter sp. TaxID=50741 RepID=UPI0034A04590
MPDSVVDVCDLSKSYIDGTEQVRVLSNLSFSITHRQSMALMGPSGSGKSTLINILSGIEPADDGDIRLFGESASNQDAAGWSELRGKRIATVFQDDNLMPTLSLGDNIRLRAQLAGKTNVDVEHWLNILGLAKLGHRFPNQVSGGQRQRAALAMAFAMQPGLLLADEPTASLDGATALQVADVLFHHQHETGCPMLLSTHDPALAARCDDILALASLARADIPADRSGTPGDGSDGGQ